MRQNLPVEVPFILQNLVLIEIQDTLKQPPSEAQSMKKATRFGIVCTVRAPFLGQIRTHLLTSLRRHCTAKHEIVYSLKLKFDLQVPVLIILCFQKLLLVQTLFYMAVACLSYSGFGDASPGNLLTGFGFFDPYCKPYTSALPDHIISHPLKLLITLLDTLLYSAACKSFRHSHSWRSPYKCILQSMYT